MVVGGGVSAASFAVQLVRSSSTPVEITIIEPRKHVGRGLAYSATDPDHRLNAPLDIHWIDPQRPLELRQWCEAANLLQCDTGSRTANGQVFLRRSDLGEYLSAQLNAHASDARTGSSIRHVCDTAVSARVVDGRYCVASERHGEVAGEMMVIATGNPVPSLRPPFSPEHRSDPRIIANPLDRLHVGMLAKECKTGLTTDGIYNGMELREMTGMDVIGRIVEKANEISNASIINSAVECLQWSSSDFKLIPALNCLEEHAAALEDEARNRVMQDIKQWKQHWNYYVRNEPGGSHSIGSFLSQVALGTTQQPRQDGVALLTVHSAKGMEFEVVFVVGMNEGTFPDYRAVGDSLDEEQRNAFVAVTRSRRLLYLSYPKMKMMPWGDEKAQRPSRFLEPILKTIADDNE